MKNKILIILFILGLVLSGVGVTFIVKGKGGYITEGEARLIGRAQDNLLKMTDKLYQEQQIPPQERDIGKVIESINTAVENIKTHLLTRQILTGTIFLYIGLGSIFSSLAIKFIFKN
jgi:hypothetical protein